MYDYYCHEVGATYIKPGARWPAGAPGFLNYFGADVCMCVCVCPPPRV